MRNAAYTDSVTVIIPHHRSTTEFLTDTIRSVVMQTRPVEEIVVVNDVGSRGPAWARNKAASQAQTAWLLLLDADDTIHPAFVEAALHTAETTRADIVVPSDAPLTSAIFRDNYLPYCCLVRRSVWNSLRGHQEPSPRGQGLCDWDFWIRVWLGGMYKVGYIHSSAFEHRDRPDSMSKWTNEHFSAMRDDLRRRHGITEEDLK